MLAHIDHGTHRHVLRFLFDDAEVALGLGDGATLLDVAHVLDQIGERHHGLPDAIQVIQLALPETASKGSAS